MDVFVIRRLLDPFLSIRPKVFLAVEDRTEWTSATTHDSPYEVWLYEPTADGAKLTRADYQSSAEDEWVAIPSPSPSPSVLAPSSEPSHNILQTFQTWCETQGVGTPVKMCKPCEETPTQEWIGRVVTELLSEVVRGWDDTAQVVADRNSELYELRQESLQSRVAMEAMQNELDRLRACPQRMIYTARPNAETVSLTPQSGTLVQTLPAAAEGLAGFDLHVRARQTGEARSRLVVRLYALDMDEILGTWLVTPPSDAGDWVRCTLPQTLTSPAHNLELHLQAIGTGGPLYLSLTDAEDWHRTNATPESEVSKNLAMVIWHGGVPGRSQPSPRGWLESESEGAVEFALASAEFKRVRKFCPRPESEGVSFVEVPEGGFQQHAVGTTPTVVLLPHGCPPGVRHVSIEAKITHPDADSDIEYGILITDVNDPSALQEYSDWHKHSDTLGFSGWVRVPRDGESHAVLLTLPQPLKSGGHLVLANRLPKGTSSHNAWGGWLAVRQRVEGVALGQPQPHNEERTRRSA